MAQPQRCSAKVSPPPPLDVTKGSGEWKLFKQMWENYEVVAKLGAETEDYRRALFLHTVGQEGLRLYNGLQLGLPAGQQPTVQNIIDAFDAHFVGVTNVIYERFVFNKRDQRKDEPIEDYVAALRTLAKTCNFTPAMHDSLLRDRIVIGIRDQATREKLLQERDLTLQACIDHCRSAESTSHQMRAMGEETTDAHAVRSYKQKSRKTTSHHTSHQERRCKFCGQTHNMRKEDCPAYGQYCKFCKKPNHFAVVCMQKKKKKLHAVVDSESEESEDEVLLAVGGGQKNKTIKAEMLINKQKIVCQVDSGASVNVISSKHVNSKHQVEACTTKLHVYNGETIKAEGRVKLELVNPRTGDCFLTDFIVVKQDLTTLLGKTTSEVMKLITVNYGNFEEVAIVKDNDIFSEYNDVFDPHTQGSLPGLAHLKVDTTIPPVISPSSRVPHSMRDKVKSELDKLERKDIIAPVKEPTDWCSRMVVATKKSGEPRICIDPRPLNEALRREHYPLPVMEDILPRLVNSTVFSRLDLANAYWHVQLDEESSKLTTFQTPYGRYRWKRLPFGTSVSSEMFQNRLDQQLERLDGVIGVSDDVIIHGKDMNEHDENLKKFLDKCRETGMRLNLKKAELRKSEISFLGHRVTKDGLMIDPEKIEAILQMPKPQDVEGVRRFCGFVNYLAKFLPKLSDVLDPIRQLAREGAPWQWTRAQDEAFKTVQELVTKAPVLAFYDSSSELTIQCDSSQKGLGAALTQNGRPIAFASRALTDTETRYAQIEKEMLAIVYSLDRFHQYAFGRHTVIDSDHKPLESVLKKPLANAPRRLQGMILRIQGYDITVRYKKGKEMYLADTLSRAHVTSSANNQGDLEAINMVQFLLIREERLKKLKEETKFDKTLQKLTMTAVNGWPEDKHEVPAEILPFYSFRDEITIQDGLLFKGERVIVPTSLRPEMKQAVHSTHLGMEGCLKRARESLYWPGMNAEIRQFIEQCETCQMFQPDQPKEKLMSHPIPSRPWEKIGTDIFQHEDKYYLVTVDYLTNFMEIDRLENLTSHQVIRKLKSHFARYGIPCTVISDNGTQFSSDTFTKFAQEWDFEHQTSSPHHPQSNGKAESAVKTAKTLLKKNKDDQFLALLNLRNTPNHSGTSPAHAFFGRRTRTLIPTTPNLLTQNSKEDYRLKLQNKQDKVEELFNKRAKDLKALTEGDRVMLKPFGLSKSKKWASGIVTKRLTNRSYEVKSEGAIYRRNRIHLRLAPQSDTEPVTYPQHAAPALIPTSDAQENLKAPEMQIQLHPEMPRREQLHPETPRRHRPEMQIPPHPGTPQKQPPLQPSPVPRTPSPSQIPRPQRQRKSTKHKDFVYN